MHANPFTNAGGDGARQTVGVIAAVEGYIASDLDPDYLLMILVDVFLGISWIWR
jgi:hypothetical protein